MWCVVLHTKQLTKPTKHVSVRANGWIRKGLALQSFADALSTNHAGIHTHRHTYKNMHIHTHTLDIIIRYSNVVKIIQD